MRVGRVQIGKPVIRRGKRPPIFKLDFTDLWIGVYLDLYKSSHMKGYWDCNVYICFVPVARLCFGIHHFMKDKENDRS